MLGLVRRSAAACSRSKGAPEVCSTTKRRVPPIRAAMA